MDALPDTLPNDVSALQEMVQLLLQEKLFLLEEKHSLLEEKHSLLEEKHSLLEEKHSLLEEKHSLLEEKHSLLEEKHSLLEEKHSLLEEKQRLDRRIEVLQEQIRLYLAKRFGRSSEQRFPEHPSLFDEAEQEATAHPEAESAEEAQGEADKDGEVAVAGHVRKKRGRQPLPEFLPRVEVIHDLPPEEKSCDTDGAALVEIGREVSEQLDIIPAQIQVLRHIRIKYGCPHCHEGVKTAPLPPQPIPKSQASPGLLAYVCTAKYVDGLPLYRQTTILQRCGMMLSRSTLAHYMVKTGQLVQPLVNLLRDRALDSGYLLMDETVVQVLKEKNRSAASQSYMWVQRTGSAEAPIILFDYARAAPGRCRNGCWRGSRGICKPMAMEGITRSTPGRA